MITITYRYETKEHIIKEGSNTFHDVKKALRFLYAMKGKIFFVTWACDDPEDNEYLNRKYIR